MTASRTHALAATLAGDPADVQGATYGIVRVLGARYRDAIVPGTFTIAATGDPVIHEEQPHAFRLTWETVGSETPQPDEVTVVLSLPYKVWNYVGETLAYDAAKHEWADVAETIVAVLRDVYESDREVSEG